MNATIKSILISLIAFSSLVSTIPNHASVKDKLTKNEYTVLKVCEGVIQLFKQSKDEIWPGYNLAQRPFIVYIPKRWALLFNWSKSVEGFSEYPKEWPNLGCSVLIHYGEYKDLIGQLVFDLPIDTIKTVAIGITENNLDSLANPEQWAFGLIVHEGFHQFQSERFGEIPWEREERYPILDTQNTSLAYLEIKLLSDALAAMQSNNKERCRLLLEQFIAVRNYRWQHSDPFLARYEQGQEIREGTAKYVEMKCLELMKRINYKSALKGFTTSLRQNFDSFSFPNLLIRDFRDQTVINSIQPEDMSRNRIYPIGSAIGFLLDYLHIDWKSKAQKAGTQFTFQGVLFDGFESRDDHIESLVNRAKHTYDYQLVLASTDKIIGEYLEGFNREVDEFERQAGYRVQIDFAAKSLSRSRSTRAKKWIIEKGAQSVCKNYEVYTLKNTDLLLQIQNSAIREHIDWDTKKYSIIFFTSLVPNIFLDSSNVAIADKHTRSFQLAEISGANFKFKYSSAGVVTLKGKQIAITLNQ